MTGAGLRWRHCWTAAPFAFAAIGLIAGVLLSAAPTGLDADESIAILPRPSSKDAAVPPGIRLILHVGPPKTATTSIQCQLDALERSGTLSALLSAKVVEKESCRPSEPEQRRLLQQYQQRFHQDEEVFEDSAKSPSNATWLTTYKRVIEGSSFLPQCIDVWAESNEAAPFPDCWGGSYLRYIRNYHRHEKRNVFVVSNEILAMKFGNIEQPKQCSRIFAGMLDSLGTNSTVDIVFTHRHYFDWVVSMHGQEFGDKFGVKPRLDKWPGEGPDRGGKEVPTLEKYISNHEGPELLFRAIACFRAASRENERVRLKVLNYHDGNVLSAFFDALAGDSRIASKLVNATGASRRENAASTRSNAITYDRIAIAALNQFFFDTSTPRADARWKIEQLVNASGLKMIYKCPVSEEFHEELLRHSIRLWKAAFPRNGSAEKDVSREFWRAVDSKRFCDVDADAIATHHLPRLMKMSV